MDIVIQLYVTFKVVSCGIRNPYFNYSKEPLVMNKTLYMCYVPDSTDTQLPAIGTQFLTLCICIQIIQWLNSWSKLFSKLKNQMWSDVYFVSLIRFTFFLEIYNINVKYINCFFNILHDTKYNSQRLISMSFCLSCAINMHIYIYIFVIPWYMLSALLTVMCTLKYIIYVQQNV